MKKALISIKKLKGIKDHKSRNLIAIAGFGLKKIQREKEVNYLFKLVTNYVKRNKLAKILKTENQFIYKKREIKNFQGIKHINFLPVRGQRSKTNAKTQKSKRPGYKNKKKIKKERRKEKKKWEFINFELTNTPQYRATREKVNKLKFLKHTKKNKKINKQNKNNNVKIQVK